MTDREKLIELMTQAENKELSLLEFEKKTLADYLLANGVIVPPCKVGDTVYHSKNIYKGKKRINTIIEPITVDSFVIGDSGRLQINTCDNSRNEWIYYDITDFGRIVFLTREEAEQALKEEQNHDSK